MYNINFNKTFFFNSKIKYIENISYLGNLLENKKLLIFIKLLSKIEQFRFIRLKLFYQVFYNIYGFKQAGRLQNQKIVLFFKSLKFNILNIDLNLLISQKDGRDILQKNEKGIIIVNIFLNDFRKAK